MKNLFALFLLAGLIIPSVAFANPAETPCPTTQSSSPATQERPASDKTGDLLDGMIQILDTAIEERPQTQERKKEVLQTNVID